MTIDLTDDEPKEKDGAVPQKKRSQPEQQHHYDSETESDSPEEQAKEDQEEDGDSSSDKSNDDQENMSLSDHGTRRPLEVRGNVTEVEEAEDSTDEENGSNYSDNEESSVESDEKGQKPKGGAKMPKKQAKKTVFQPPETTKKQTPKKAKVVQKGGELARGISNSMAEVKKRKLAAQAEASNKKAKSSVTDAEIEETSSPESKTPPEPAEVFEKAPEPAKGASQPEEQPEPAKAASQP